MTAMRDFCTYFDINYLSRSLALYCSLERHDGAFRLFMLCLDDDCYSEIVARRLAHAVPIRLRDL